LVPRAIDEIPLIAVAAAFAQGTTRISGIGELRGKESDRIAAIERLLAAVGIATEALPAGLSVQGGAPASTGTIVDTHDDHRTAMAAAVLACAAGPIAIDSERSIDVSFPSFLSTLESVRP
jgi:3-phosphoshikimate 1-carboxyvinyltransferase